MKDAKRIFKRKQNEVINSERLRLWFDQWMFAKQNVKRTPLI